jgi:midasin
LRSLGDTFKSIRRRFEEIAERVESDDDQKQPTGAEPREDEQKEYAAPDDPDNDKQALGPSLAHDQISKLSELRIDDSETAEQVPKPDEPIPDAQTSEQPQPFSILDDFDPSISAPKGANPDGTEQSQATTDSAPSDAKDSAVVQKLVPEEFVSPELRRMTDEVVEVELRRWQDAGQPDDGARELWARYSSVTHNLAYDLCEQLRLILEPTLATRLKGDYRTGKRLNMKKVIPYIASEFTKDKIWLRRSRPSKREYQILLALDDSKSMREGRSAHLAFETLALVTKALDRLEAGDTAVVRFGETVDVLHDFGSSGRAGSGFSDADGAKVIQNFHFDQRATNVLSLLEHTLEVLADARMRNTTGSSSAADLWQLEIIISDGRCQDHEKLRSILRRASEERIMVVFVVVDALRAQGHGKGGSSLANSSSILSMNQATYAMVDGKMELQLQRYLDSFPFEYYVVLRDVESLPDVLAGTLKQFFERMSEE